MCVYKKLNLCTHTYLIMESNYGVARVSIANKNGETFVHITQDSGIGLYATVNEIVISMTEYKGFVFILQSIDKSLSTKSSTYALTSKPSAVAITAEQQQNDFHMSEYNPETCSGVDGKQDYVKFKTVHEQQTLITIREPLLDIYCEEFCDRLPEKISARCTGCILGTKERTYHDVCKMMTKCDRVNLIFPDIMNELSDSYLEEKLRNRRPQRSYKSSQYIKKDQLLAIDKWLKKLKLQIDRFL